MKRVERVYLKNTSGWKLTYSCCAVVVLFGFPAIGVKAFGIHSAVAVVAVSALTRVHVPLHVHACANESHRIRWAEVMIKAMLRPVDS